MIYYIKLSIRYILPLLACSLAYAAQENISSDRPDFVESSDVVGIGRQQLEAGFSLERSIIQDEEIRTFTTPLLLRLGLSDTCEARIETDGWANISTHDLYGTTRETGLSDISLGLKLHLQDNSALLPAVAVLLHLDIDSGSTYFRGNGLRPSLRTVAEWELSKTTSIGVMPGIIFDRNNQHDFTSGMLAATYGVQINPMLHGFLELAAQQIAKSEDGGNIITYDSGLSYMINKNTQIDTIFSVGANKNSPDWTIGFGFSHRFGNL